LCREGKSTTATAAGLRLNLCSFVAAEFWSQLFVVRDGLRAAQVLQEPVSTFPPLLQEFDNPTCGGTEADRHQTPQAI